MRTTYCSRRLAEFVFVGLVLASGDNFQCWFTVNFKRRSEEPNISDTEPTVPATNMAAAAT